MGPTDILVPMVSSAEQAREVVAAAHYPPLGRRGVGSALARSARWNRVDGYLANAADHVGVHVQVENAEGVAAAAEIAAVDGIDSVFVGPSDLAASMGVLGQQTHPDVVAAVQQTFDAVKAAGKPVGVNAFDPKQAKAYLDGRRDSGAAAGNGRDSGAAARNGVDFILVGADVAMLARGSEKLAGDFAAGDQTQRASY